MRTIALVAALALTTLLGGLVRSAAQIEDTRYREVSLADVVRAPRDFDEALVRVRGLCNLHFESTVLSAVPQGPASSEISEWLWLEVGWPLSEKLTAMNGEVVVVEARLDADMHGHMGVSRATLRDIRAIWRPGYESEAYILNHETRTRCSATVEIRDRLDLPWGSH